MVKARYYKSDGKKARAKVALPEAIFDGVVNEAVMHRVVKAYLSNRRQGTGSAKNRSAVRGGARKPWRQKGTGRARQGTIRAPQWEGGGVAFPPIPHSWRQSVPKKVRGLARRSALNDRAAEERVLVADLPELEAPKTRDLAGFLATVGAEGKVLVLTHEKRENVYLSARNLPDVEVRVFGTESVYDVLWAHTVVIEREALEAGAEADDADEADAEEAKPAAKAKKKPASKPKAKAKKKAAPKPKAKKAEEESEAEAEVEDEPAEADEAEAAAEEEDDA